MRAIPCVAVLLAVVGLGLGACRRPTNSLEYIDAMGIHDRLVSAEGDEAYLNPEMTQAEELLAKVPPDSLDAQSARELLATIRTERARVQKERADGAKEAAATPTRDDWAAEEPQGEEAAAEEADAGPAQPVQGMALAEFRRRFGDCFNPGQDIVLVGAGVRQTYELRDREECRQRHVGFDGLVVVIETDKVGGFAQKSALKLTLPDGGAVPPRAETRQPAPQQAAPPEQGTTPPSNAPDQSGRDYNSIKY